MAARGGRRTLHKLVSVQIQALLLITLLLVLGNGVAEDQSESTDSEGQQLFHESVHILGGRGAPVVRRIMSCRFAILLKSRFVPILS